MSLVVIVISRNSSGDGRESKSLEAAPEPFEVFHL
jgi:hypothetical protein